MNSRKAFFRTFEKSGFTLVRQSNHAIWRCPCGHAQIVTPCTPGKGNHSVDNCERRRVRTLQVCREKLRATV